MDAYLRRVSRLARFHRSLTRQARPSCRYLRTEAAIPPARARQDVPSLATLPTCPAPSCTCEPLPQLPDGLDIDHTSKLDGTMATYDAHVIVRSGRSDWPSKIEDDEGLPEVKLLRQMLGRGGKYANPFYNVLISTSDTGKTEHETGLPSGRGIHMFPSGMRLRLRHGDSLEAAVENFIKTEILPTQLSPRAKEMIPQEQHQNLLRVARETEHSEAELLSQPTILVCGHGNRDQRCGIIGPVLKTAFRKAVKQQRPCNPGKDNHIGWNPSIGLISHIGGHKFAGNVIIYFPSSSGWQHHPLSGMGIWYGRVEPKHVDGIVKESVLGGAIIKDLFRGGIDGKGGILRLADVESIVSSSIG